MPITLVVLYFASDWLFRRFVGLRGVVNRCPDGSTAICAEEPSLEYLTAQAPRDIDRRDISGSIGCAVHFAMRMVRANAFRVVDHSVSNLVFALGWNDGSSQWL